LDADATVNTGGKVNPVPIRTFDIFARTFMDTSNRTGINAISDAFTSIRNNRVWHSILSLKDLVVLAGYRLLLLAYQDWTTHKGLGGRTSGASLKVKSQNP